MINNEVKQRVKSILETNKNTRDCDRELIAEIWEKDIKDYCRIPYQISGRDLLNMLKDGQLTSSETIRRCRQRLQEENETLRGYKYKLRKQLGEEVRATISK
jgi:hypothetical protein